MRDMEQSSRQPSDDIASPSEAPNDPSLPLAPPDGHVIDSMGKLSLTDNHAVYIGSSHWVTILEDVSCLDEKSVVSHLMMMIFSDPTPQRRAVRRVLGWHHKSRIDSI